jgi:hypothetical protein
LKKKTKEGADGAKNKVKGTVDGTKVKVKDKPAVNANGQVETQTKVKTQ